MSGDGRALTDGTGRRFARFQSDDLYAPRLKDRRLGETSNGDAGRPEENAEAAREGARTPRLTGLYAGPPGCAFPPGADPAAALPP